ncbi:MAG TPA: hypothetical protein VMZ71_05790, partial [Gemmataceae bacterium]|nr:hypothetical protein [Gemmataceae bacterium]
LSAYDSDASADAQMKKWAEDLFLRGVPPDGDRAMWFSDGYPDGKNPDGRSPHATRTDKDGRFEVTGCGAGQLVHLRVRGPGVADTEVVTLNRDGFDPAPINKVAQSHKYKEFGGKWAVSGPDPVVVAEPEKIIRGTVTDTAGKPRAGVTVTFSRTGKAAAGAVDLNGYRNAATTGANGRYEIRGARKHKGYMVETPPDAAGGFLPCQGFADDTAGYEPVAIDLKCARGVVVTGTVRNKSTGEPVVVHMYTAVLANNPFVEKYPPLLGAASNYSRLLRTDANGRYRVVTIPGPVLLMAAPEKGHGGEFKPPAPDPKYATHFHRDRGLLMYDVYGGGRGPVQGNWCKVIEAAPADTELTVDVDLEPATKRIVKVVDADGKPVADCGAAGVTHIEFEVVEFPGTNEVTVFNLEPGEERLLAVFHEKRKLLATATVKAGDKNPVVKLGPGGSVPGRAIDADGKPLAGLTLHLGYDRREVSEAFEALSKQRPLTTDANGEFRIDGVFPGQPFGIVFARGQTVVGPRIAKAARHTVTAAGEVLKLGDLPLGEAKE